MKTETVAVVPAPMSQGSGALNSGQSGALSSPSAHGRRVIRDARFTITDDARQELMERSLGRWTKIKRTLGEAIEHPAVEVCIIVVVLVYGFLVVFQMLFAVELHPRGFPELCPVRSDLGTGTLWNPTDSVQCCLNKHMKADWPDDIELSKMTAYKVTDEYAAQPAVNYCTYTPDDFGENKGEYNSIWDNVDSLGIWNITEVDGGTLLSCDSCGQDQPFCSCPTADFVISVDGWRSVRIVLEVVDFCILGIFLIEITAKTVAFGQPYICDPWNAFDAFIILLSISLAVLNRFVTDETVQQILGLRGVLRILRLVLIFRRASEAQSSLGRQKKASDISSPVERVLELLDALSRSRHFKRTTRWALHSAFKIIQEGNLYELTTQDNLGDGEYGKEVKAWIDTGTGQKTGRQGKRGTAKDFTTFVEVESVHNKQIEDCLTKEKLCSWGFDIWYLDNLCGGHGNCLPVLLERVLICGGLWKQFNFDKEIFMRFIGKIRDQYIRENPYHNALHGADVTQTVFWLAQQGKIAEYGHWTDHDYVAMTIGAACHDVGHPGFTNVYCNKTNHPHALLYNDKSTLENYHVAFTYSVICEHKGCNIFEALSDGDFKSVRESMIAVILSTDMTHHFGDLAKLKTRVNTVATDKANAFPKEDSKDDKVLLMSVVMHAADISNPTKSTAVYLRWTKSVITEFFNQGDCEKAANVPVSMFMDRKTTNIAKMQMGFMDIIVKPLYAELGAWCENAQENPIINKTCVYWLDKNRNFWTDKVERMEQQMVEGAKGDGQQAALPDAPVDPHGVVLAELTEGANTPNSPNGPRSGDSSRKASQTDA